ncbi:GDSL esterase/lipase at3g48460 [Phtheirospermum japonicum]|uniref:GDSL esterase/lipase at3g48460 n=1 Tax=Phtheirospermum japonicum TaxID=374723 RepID=A0A830CCN0_9LAMI|nr:GDSL esterase/lipase at3g48460 [Phtheirospermum japonicum]
MNKPIYQSLPLAFLIIFLYVSSSSAHDKPKDDPPSSSLQDLKGCFPKVYAFGDSDTDTGNAPLLGTHFQGGQTYNISGTIPSRLVIDFLCAALALPPPPPFMKGLSGNSNSGINFAISGSTSFSADIFGKNLTSLFWKGVPVNYKTQIDWLNKYLNQAKGNGAKGTEGKADMANALFWIGQMGVSDYTSAQGIAYADFWNAYLEIATNPKKYGIEEPFKACCGSGEGQFNFNKNKMCGSSGTSVCKDPSKYVNFDGCHLTEAMHKHLADMFLHQGFCQPSFDELVKSKKGV